MNNQLENFKDKESVKKALETVIGKPISNLEMEMAIATCMKHKLNPFLKEIYLVPMGTKLAPVINYLVMVNKVRGKYPNLKETWIRNYNSTKTSFVSLELTLENDKNSVSQVVFMNEYNTNFNLWKTKPTTMLQKVARAQCYRMLDSEFQDLYIEEELEDIKKVAKETKPIKNVSKTPQIEAKVVEPNQLLTLNIKDIKVSENLLTGNALFKHIIFEEAEHLYINSMTGEKYTCVSDFLGKKDLSKIPNIELCAQQGKDMHNALHQFFLNPSKFKLDLIKENELKHTKFGVINALNELNSFKPTILASELIVADEKNMLCGTIDLIFSYEVKGETIYAIADFKSSWKDKDQINNYMNQIYTYKQLLKNTNLEFAKLSRQKLKLMIIICINKKQLGTKILPIHLLDTLKENYINNLNKLVNGDDDINADWDLLKGEING